MKILLSLCSLTLLSSCVSTESTLKNIDKTAIRPAIKNKAYAITEYATDTKYGYDKDYPINIGFIHEKQEDINVAYFFNGLSGPKGEKITYKKIDTCCPFPSKNSLMGAGTIGIYEVSFEGSSKTIILYFNIYEKGKILCPKGFTIKQIQEIDK